MSDSHGSREDSSLKEDVRLLKKDMWLGNGKPGLTTRMQTAEDRLDHLEDYNEKRELQLNTRLNLMIGAVFTLAGAVILQLIFKH